MFSQLKEALYLLRNSTRVSVNLRRRLQIYLFSLVVILFCFIITFVVAFDFFSPHKTINASLDLQLERFEHRIKNYFDNLAAQGVHFSSQVSKEIEKTLSEKRAIFEDVQDNQRLIAAIEANTYNLLYNALRIAECSGAFIILDTTVNSSLPNAQHSRAGSYLKLANVNSPKPVSPQVLWTRGIHEVGHNNNHIFHNKWQLEFDVSRLPFYRAILESASKNLLDCYYYSPAFTLYGTWETIMILCVPLVGKSGQVYGLCGFEINSIFFKLLHAEPGSAFKRMIGLVAQRQGDAILPKTGLEFGTKEGYLAGLGAGALASKPSGSSKHYRLIDASGGEARNFIGLDVDIFLSPLSGKQGAEWVTVCMIPKDDYDHLVNLNYMKITLFCLIFFALASLLIYYISRRYHLPILQGFAAIKSGETTCKTYINEIDDLLEFLSANDTGHDVELSAFYEFSKNMETLSKAERTVFDLYIEGHSAGEIADIVYVSINTIKTHNKNIYRKLNISSRKELLLYAQMMKAPQ